MEEGLDAFKSGQVAMQMNFRLLPRPATRTRMSAATRSASSPTRGQNGRGLARSAARASRSSPTPTTRTTRCSTSSGSPSPTCRRSGGRSAATPATRRCSTIRTLPAAAPFAADFLKAMVDVKDFWQEPTYAELLLAMQKRVHDYVVADQGTAQEALDSSSTTGPKSSRTTARSDLSRRPTGAIRSGCPRDRPEPDRPAVCGNTCSD